MPTLKRVPPLLGLAILLVACTSNRVTTDRDPVDSHEATHRRGGFTSFRGQHPPELQSVAAHWIDAQDSDARTLEKLRGKLVWLQFNF